MCAVVTVKKSTIIGLLTSTLSGSSFIGESVLDDVVILKLFKVLKQQNDVEKQIQEPQVSYFYSAVGRQRRNNF